MSEKINCVRCGGSGVVSQGGSPCVDCGGSGHKSMIEIERYIDALELIIRRHESETCGESGRLGSSDVEAERDDANEYATDAKEEITSLREKNLALALAVEEKQKALEELFPWFDGEHHSDHPSVLQIKKAIALSTSPAKQIIADFRKECEGRGNKFAVAVRVQYHNWSGCKKFNARLIFGALAEYDVKATAAQKEGGT